MKEKVMSFDELNRLIFQKYNQFGIVAPDGKPILTSSPQFVKLSNDIQIVNRNILDYKNFTQKDLYNLTPRQFEEFVAELLSKLGYSVDLTQATRDGGKDILVANHNEIGNFLYYIECKKYEPTKPIGVRLVRELYGTISVEKVTAGMIVTSSYFSPDAIEFTEKIKHQMKLVDYIEMKKWIDKKLISC
jgi:restriction endonuclease Mrr